MSSLTFSSSDLGAELDLYEAALRAPPGPEPKSWDALELDRRLAHLKGPIRRKLARVTDRHRAYRLARAISRFVQARPRSYTDAPA
jgi:hypothetical protein